MKIVYLLAVGCLLALCTPALAQPSKPMSHRMDSLCKAYKRALHKIAHPGFQQENTKAIRARKDLMPVIIDSLWNGGYNESMLKNVLGEPQNISAALDTTYKPDGYWDIHEVVPYHNPKKASEKEKSIKPSTWYRYECVYNQGVELYYFEIQADAIVGCREELWLLLE